MPNYRRANLAGGIYFITQVTYQREPWLCSEVGGKALREAIQKVQKKFPPQSRLGGGYGKNRRNKRAIAFYKRVNEILVGISG